MIPPQLQREDISFVLLERSGKKPFQESWQNKTIKYNEGVLLDHLINGGNYGVMGGGQCNLIIIDFDSVQVQEEVIKKLPPTFTVKTGSGKLHKYFFSDSSISFKIFDEEMNTLADVQGKGKQVVAPGSVHPNGNKYEVIEDKDISFINYAEVKALLMPYDKKQKKEQAQLDKPKEYQNDNFLDMIKSNISMESVLSDFGVNISKNPSNCPLHTSKGGKCLGWNRETAHCFHCDGSWNIFSFVKEMKKCDFKEALQWLVNKGGLEKEYEESKKRFKEQQKNNSQDEKKQLKYNFLSLVYGKERRINEATELIVDYILRNNFIYTTKDDLKSEVWIYNDGVYIPQGRTRIKEIMREILEEHFNIYFYNQVMAKIEPDTYIEPDVFFKTNYKYEIPVRNGILNVITRELSPFNPEKIFFNKLPVIYDASASCPTIDKFLSEVLANEEDKKVYYEIGGSALVKEYTFEKAIMFVGSGRNGKGKSLELFKRMVGAENCASIPLVALQPESFSVSELFGKLFNLAGDIGNKDLQDTSMFKSLTGRDLVTSKRKFLTGLTFENYAKFVFACNELPTVYDMSRGFWDRWVLLEYPYTFVTKEEYEKTTDRKMLKIKDDNIIDKISTETELSGLFNQCLDGLQRLIQNRKFSLTKGTQDIKDLWIRKANSFVAFALDMIEEDYDSHITKKEMRKRYSAYCKKHFVPGKSDYVIRKFLQEMFGANDNTIRVGTYPDQELVRIWEGIRWKSSL